MIHEFVTSRFQYYNALWEMQCFKSMAKLNLVQTAVSSITSTSQLWAHVTSATGSALDACWFPGKFKVLVLTYKAAVAWDLPT